MTLTTSQRDRAAGVLVGQACGDALGVPYEFGAPPANARPQMLGGGLGNYAPGEWSDDTQMAACIAEVSATGADLTSVEALDAIAANFERWYAAGPADVGIQTAAVLTTARTCSGSPSVRLREASRLVHERTGRSAGNGALMRTAIVGLTRLEDPEHTARSARAVAELTHHDHLAGDACVLWSELVRQLVVVDGGPELPDLDELLSLLPQDRRDQWRHWWLDSGSPTTRPVPKRFNPNGFTVPALQAALAAIHLAIEAPGPEDLVRTGLTEAVLAGNDTDTVAAIAGGPLGALAGLTVIPTEWEPVVHGWPNLRWGDLVDLSVATAKRGLVSDPTPASEA